MSIRSNIVIVTITLVILLAGCSSTGDGREGNRLYHKDDFVAAADAYSKGIVELEDNAESPYRSRYYNNLGLASHRLEDYKGAQEAFVQAAANADENIARSRAAYNAGNNAFRMDDKKLATEFYIQSLVADPTFVDAKINYEYVKRLLQDEEQEGGGDSKPPEPSEYALELKAQADALVAQQQYREAYHLMDEGRKVDPTVEAFATFIQRVASVADIDDIPA